MDGLLLNSLDAQLLEFLIEHLTKIHDDRLMDLLPQMGPEDLDERNLQGWDFPVKEDTGQIELNLETDINVCPVALLVSIY